METKIIENKKEKGIIDLECPDCHKRLEFQIEITNKDDTLQIEGFVHCLTDSCKQELPENIKRKLIAIDGDYRIDKSFGSFDIRVSSSNQFMYLYAERVLKTVVEDIFQ